MKILIAGDSFAAEWPNATKGWVNLLANRYEVTNLAQAGVSEYKIYKQLSSVNLNTFDCIIVSHTSPSRIHTRNHPLHTSGFHKDCDLIYTDLESRGSIFNTNLAVAKGWFEYHYDDEYQIDMYNLLRKEIATMIGNRPYVSMTHIDISTSLAIEKLNIDFSTLWAKERGTINHYTEDGNNIIYNLIVEHIT